MSYEIIFVSMKNEGTEVWRPMKAINIRDKVYKIIGYSDSNDEEDELEFEPGEIVICEIQNKSGEEILIAIDRT